jgi:hypothetical protein
MSVPAYMLTVKNVPGVFGAVRDAGVPDRFTHSFLKQLGFASSTDRGVINVMKSLRFLDESSVPTERYKRYRDPALSGAVMAEALRDAYSDLFTVSEKANTMSPTQLKGAFKRISGKGDSVADKMSATFRALAGLADWDATATTASTAKPADEVHPAEPAHKPTARTPRQSPDVGQERAGFVPTLRHDIHVHLPPTQDVKVYDAIFRSLREHFG